MTDTSRSRETELKEESAGFVDEWNIRDEKDVHPSHKTEVWTKEEISRLTAHWLQAGIQQGYAKALADVKKEREIAKECLKYLNIICGKENCCRNKICPLSKAKLQELKK